MKALELNDLQDLALLISPLPSPAHLLMLCHPPEVQSQGQFVVPTCCHAVSGLCAVEHVFSLSCPHELQALAFLPAGRTVCDGWRKPDLLPQADGRHCWGISSRKVRWARSHIQLTSSQGAVACSTSGSQHQKGGCFEILF